MLKLVMEIEVEMTSEQLTHFSETVNSSGASSAQEWVAGLVRQVLIMGQEKKGRFALEPGEVRPIKVQANGKRWNARLLPDGVHLATKGFWYVRYGTRTIKAKNEDEARQTFARLQKLSAENPDTKKSDIAATFDQELQKAA